MANMISDAEIDALEQVLEMRSMEIEAKKIEAVTKGAPDTPELRLLEVEVARLRLRLAEMRARK